MKVVKANARSLSLIRYFNSEPSQAFVDEFGRRLRLVDTSDMNPDALPPDACPAEVEFLNLWMQLRSYVAISPKRVTTVSLEEEKVLACLALRLRDKDIATALGLSTAAVKSRMQLLFRKFGVHSRTRLIHELTRTGVEVPGVAQ